MLKSIAAKTPFKVIFIAWKCSTSLFSLYLLCLHWCFHFRDILPDVHLCKCNETSLFLKKLFVTFSAVCIPHTHKHHWCGAICNIYEITNFFTRVNTPWTSTWHGCFCVVEAFWYTVDTVVAICVTMARVHHSIECDTGFQQMGATPTQCPFNDL